LTPLLLVVVLLLLRRKWWPRLRDAARQALVEVAGPAVVRSLSPRDALDAVLAPLYGEDYEDVLVGVLGGSGRTRGKRDTAASRHTKAHFRLESINDHICRTEATWTYEFSGMQDNHVLVIFGTHQLDMAEIVTKERAFPIYELWNLNSEDELEDFVDDLRATVQIGITYRDEDGNTHAVPPCAQHGEEVAWADYQRYVTLPGDANRADLRMVRFDLYDLTDPDHVVESVESLTLKASNNGANLGFLNWAAPFPCYVREVELDVTHLPRDGETLVYNVMASSARWYRRTAVQPKWMRIDGTYRFSLNSWMMAGHGVTLLWRPENEAEPKDDLTSW
jgi:hypothetical protein